MNLQYLKTFCAVISEGGMSAAAQKLYLTQPAVSQQIRVLEEQLDVKLIIRESRPSTPTIQGQLLYDYAKRILNLTQQAEVALHTVSKQMEGEYSIGTVNTLGLHFLSPITGLLLKYNPKINLKLFYSSHESVLKKFENGELDAIILADIDQEMNKKIDGVEKYLLSKDEMLLVSSSKQTDIPPIISTNQINDFPVVFFNKMYRSFQAVLEKRFSESGVNIHPTFECNNVGTAKKIIEYGVGWGFLPYHSILKQVRSQRLQVTKVKDIFFDISIYLYAYQSERSKQLADLLYHSLKQISR